MWTLSTSFKTGDACEVRSSPSAFLIILCKTLPMEVGPTSTSQNAPAGFFDHNPSQEKVLDPPRKCAEASLVALRSAS